MFPLKRLCPTDNVHSDLEATLGVETTSLFLDVHPAL